MRYGPDYTGCPDNMRYGPDYTGCPDNMRLDGPVQIAQLPLL